MEEGAYLSCVCTRSAPLKRVRFRPLPGWGVPKLERFASSTEGCGEVEVQTRLGGAKGRAQEGKPHVVYGCLCLSVSPSARFPPCLSSRPALISLQLE